MTDEHRLASVSSASAEGQDPMVNPETNWLVHQLEAWPTRVDRERTTNIETLMQLAAKVIRATPEALPATNQAGEVAKAIAKAVIDVEFQNSHAAYEDAVVAVIASHLAALATQPATSQEGEGDRYREALRVICEEELTRTEMMQIAEFAISKNPEEAWMNDSRSLDAGLPATSQEGDQVIAAAYRAGYEQACEDNGDRVDEDDLEEEIALYLAATPTPPTLSEDLREAAQAVVDDYPAAAGTYYDLEGTDGKPGYGSIRRLAAALAQVKAS